MIRLKIDRLTGFEVNNSVEGESIEKKIERITENREPISDSSPVIYTERKDGVLPAYDIRTDRWEIAIEAMDKVSKTHLAKRDEFLNKDSEKGDGGETPVSTSDQS